MPRRSSLLLQHRHYQFIADVIKDWAGNRDIALAFADALQNTNAHFDKARFLAACGDMPAPTPKCLFCQSEAK